MWNNLPNPHSSLSPLPFTPVRDIRLDLWTYCLLRSLQSNASLGQLVHCPYYRRFSALDAGFTSPPFLLSADHYFEWRSLSPSTPLFNHLLHFPHLQFPFPKSSLWELYYSHLPHYYYSILGLPRDPTLKHSRFPFSIRGTFTQ